MEETSANPHLTQTRDVESIATKTQRKKDQVRFFRRRGWFSSMKAHRTPTLATELALEYNKPLFSSTVATCRKQWERIIERDGEKGMSQRD